MECIIDEDSPLAAILEGEGQADSAVPGHAQDTSENKDFANRFAPTLGTPTSLQARLRQRLGQPLKIHISQDATIANLTQKCSDAIGSNIHAADNQRFLEHFRYTIIASNLLSEHNTRHSSGQFAAETAGSVLETHNNLQDTWTLQGAFYAVGLPTTIAGLFRWTSAAESWWEISLRICLTTVFLIVAYLALMSHLRLQQTKVIRRKAVTGASIMITNLQALEKSSIAAFTLVKEVELVSRGYMLKSPQLPPISILEDGAQKSQSRRCVRLRRTLRKLYVESIPSIIVQCHSLANYAAPEDLEKYLDVYEIAHPDMQEAFSGAVVSEIDDQESLSALRALQWRFETLRKTLLCHLLALPATGIRSEISSWRNAVHIIESVSADSGAWVETLNEILREDEQPITVASPTTNRNTPERERSRQQLRKLNELSAELRAMQAKLHILRDDVQTAQDVKGDSVSVTPLLIAASESIGQDLRTLNQTYDSWKASLLPPSDRRHSRASSELRSPISLGGLTAVDESCAMDGPHEALLALNGLTSLSGSTAGSDEEVFEAVALPRVRKVLTREEKIAKLQDEEARRASMREQRMQGVSMVKELETVMNTRMSKRMSTGRFAFPISPRISSM